MLTFLHFHLYLSYFSLSWLLWLRSLNIVLNRNCGNGHSCLVPKLKVKAFSIVLMFTVSSVDLGNRCEQNKLER